MLRVSPDSNLYAMSFSTFVPSNFNIYACLERINLWAADHGIPIFYIMYLSKRVPCQFLSINFKLKSSLLFIDINYFKIRISGQWLHLKLICSKIRYISYNYMKLFVITAIALFAAPTFALESFEAFE